MLDLSSKSDIRVAIVSDTHCFIDPRIVETIQGCELALHAGDIGKKHILETLKQACGLVVCVRGNNDMEATWSDDEQDVISQIKITEKIALPGGVIALEHGEHHGFHTPSHDSLREKFSDAKMIVYGHTHQKVVDRFAYPWVVNPGAAGRTRTRGGASCLILTASSSAEWAIEKIRFVDGGGVFREVA